MGLYHGQDPDGPDETRRQLLQTKKELEAKRMAEMGNLREVMGIIPRLPFDKQPLPNLNAWVSLQIVDQRVVVLDVLKPFSEYWAMLRHQVAGLLSEQEALGHVQGRLKEKKSWPIRIDIYYDSETIKASEKLREAIVALAREANADMETEVRLERITWVGQGESPFYLRDGKIRTFYPEPVRRPDGGPRLLPSGLVDPNDLEQHILWRLTKPKNVPLTFRIEYDEASSQLAKRVADTAKATAKRVGLAEIGERCGDSGRAGSRDGIPGSLAGAGEKPDPGHRYPARRNMPGHDGRRNASDQGRSDCKGHVVMDGQRNPGGHQ